MSAQRITGRLVSQRMPVSEPFFDYAPPEIHAKAKPHFGPEHRMSATVTIAGTHRIECSCGEVILDGEVPTTYSIDLGSGDE